VNTHNGIRMVTQYILHYHIIYILKKEEINNDN